MLYAQKKSTTATNSHAHKDYVCETNPVTVYSMCKKYAIYSLKIQKNRHLFHEEE